MRLLLTLLLCLVGLDLQAQALWRNFFTTNQTPIVDVVAGSNATVVATTPNVFTRRFTVSSTATGVGTATNVYGTNVIGAVSEASHATNADNAVYVTTPILTNAVTNFTITSAMVTNVLPAVLTNNTTGNAGTATFVLTSTLTNQVYASNVVSGGIIPIGGVATNNPWDGAFLKGATGTRYWSQDGATLTNVPFSIFTNYAANPTAFTNVNGFGFGMDTYGMTSWWEHAVVASVGPVEIIHSGIDTNAVITTNGGRFFGSILSLAPSALSPSSNELVTASWVRNIFNVGAAYYNSDVVETGATNIDQANQFVYRYQSTIPASSIRTYTTANFLTNNGYVGAVVTTNTFSSLAGAIVVNAYLAYTGGSSTPTLTIKPEIYISTDRTNWYGEIAGAPQNIAYGTTNLYQWLVDYPATVATNAGGFYVQRRLKVGTVTGAGTRTLTVFVGTNLVSGPLDASHLTMQSPSATTGNGYLQNNQTWTGTNTFTQTIQGTATNANTATLASYVSGTLSNSISGNAATATSAVNATNLYNSNLPVPTNSPSANTVMTATSASSSAWTTSAASLPRVHYTGTANFTLNSQVPFYASAFVGLFGIGTTITTYSNTTAITSMTISNVMFGMVAATSGTNVTFKILTNGVASNIELTLLAGQTLTNDTSGATLTIPAGTSVMASLQHSGSGGSIGAKNFIWGWAY